MTTEDRLRAALRAGTPEPLDAAAIVASARRRRGVGLARVGVAAAAVVLVAGIGPRLIGGGTSDSGVQPGSSLVTPAATAARAPAPQQRAEPPEADKSSAGIPGRTLVVLPEQWCLLDGDGREVGCAPRDQRVQRIADDRDRPWLVLLAPSGRGTTALQVQQSGGWVSLRTSQVPGSADLWLGVTPADDAPEPPRGLRGLDARGEEIWRG